MKTKIIKDYTPSPTCLEFMLDDSLCRSIIGPFGSGKSTACIMEIVRRAQQQLPDASGRRRTRWVVVRNTYQQLRDTSLKSWLDWFPAGEAGIWRAMDKTFKLRIKGAPHNGQPTVVEADVLFRPLDTPDDVRQLLSLELTGGWVNEFREIPFEVPMNLIGRIGRFPPPSEAECTWSGLIMDSNPPDVDSPYYRMFEEEPDEDEMKELAQQHGVTPPEFKIWKQPGGLDEGAENLTYLPGGKQYYVNMAEMAKKQGRDQSWIDVHVHGKYGFIMDGRAVYGDTFSLDRHVWNERKPLKPRSEHIIAVGMDFGLTPAAVFGQVDIEGRWLILGELTSQECSAEEFAVILRRQITSQFPGHEMVIFGDPAGEQRSQVDARSVFDVFRAQGFKIFASEQSPRLRIDSVRAAMTRDIRQKPGLIVDKSCGMLIRGFQGGYQYKRMKVSGERYADKPDKNQYSHVHDALQYLIAYFDANRLRGGHARDFPKTMRHNMRPIQTQAYDFWADFG